MMIFGATMTAATTPAEAVDAWLAAHKDVFGVANLDVRRMDSIDGGPFTVLDYQQHIDGLPVAHSIGRIVTLNGPPAKVVFASLRTTQRPALGFAVDTIDAAAALAGVKTMPVYAGLAEWSTPELVVLRSDGDFRLAAAVRAWRIKGRVSTREELRAYTFFVAAATGDLLHVRDDVFHQSGPACCQSGDVCGTVSAEVTPLTCPASEGGPCTEVGPCPNAGCNAPVLTPLPTVRVMLDDNDNCADADCAGDWAVTDANGCYSITPSGSGPLSVKTDVKGSPCPPPVLAGPWVNVVDLSDDPYPLDACEDGVNPPATVDLTLFAGSADFLVPQTNCFFYVTFMHDFFDSYLPAFTQQNLNESLTCYVNDQIPGICNARGTGGVLRFGRTGPGPPPHCSGLTCLNPAYSSVIAHEYGHIVEDKRGLDVIESFGEGFADALSILTFDDPAMGKDGYGFDTQDRHYDCPDHDVDVPYPCPDDPESFPGRCIGDCSQLGPKVHACGRILAGVWWKIKKNIQAKYQAQSPLNCPIGGITDADECGLEVTRRLFMDWFLITLGEDPTDSFNSAYPGTAVEISTTDWVRFQNAHAAELGAAYQAHSIQPISFPD